ncbi:MAG: hypothetical protein A3H02_00635 [Candidatus Niyogibacteria bacterium RIFCSPLOWO2_12_FULL_41_13]|uniref:Uncharacterized protein n=1 Tax=Candidatus Niyogibacteria bacterium RIFCSPLOWO2_12_FULL_41_13 TaxID=1801726 RepID=A0A1G2F2U4_9BACT|nr:MAG: hypothetical protein A3H02_00635 [Candidatus Niyogibacteria bacterium RIFCSPLOWO2_12_FULL_41_13]
MNKTILISIIVVIAIVAVVLIAKPFGRKETVEQPPKAQITPPSAAKEDSTAAINQLIEETETIDLDKEFQAIDADLQSL